MEFKTLNKARSVATIMASLFFPVLLFILMPKLLDAFVSLSDLFLSYLTHSISTVSVFSFLLPHKMISAELVICGG